MKILHSDSESPQKTGDELHSSLSAYFRIFTLLADDHVIAPHAADTHAAALCAYLVVFDDL
jgi:hypothetical protein